MTRRLFSSLPVASVSAAIPAIATPAFPIVEVEFTVKSSSAEAAAEVAARFVREAWAATPNSLILCEEHTESKTHSDDGDTMQYTRRYRISN